VGKLLEYGFIDGTEPTEMGRVVCRHFLDPKTAFVLLEGARNGTDPYEVVADVELLEER
jgi:helicase